MKRRLIRHPLKIVLSLMVFGLFIFMAGGSDGGSSSPSRSNQEEAVEPMDSVVESGPLESEPDPTYEENQMEATQNDLNEETDAPIYNNSTQSQNEDDSDINE